MQRRWRAMLGAVLIAILGLSPGAVTASPGAILIYTGNGALDEGYVSFGTAAGKTVETHAALPPELGAYDCIVLPINGTSTAGAPFSAPDKAAFATYLAAGGRLIALGEHSGFAGSIATMNDLAATLSADVAIVSNAIDGGFNVTTDIIPSVYTAGVSSLTYAATSEVTVAVSGDAVGLARTITGATIFMAADPMGPGLFVLSGDSNVFSDSSGDGYTVRNNGVLVANLCGAREGRLQVDKFYDLNANGVNDGEAAIPGWQVRIHDGFDIYASTPVDLVVEPDDYTVSESAPVQANWIPTTPTSVDVTVDAGETEVVAFGNVCLGAGGGRTLGFWSNKNGRETMNDGGSLAPELALLTSLNLRNQDGSPFDPATYNAFRTWLLAANGANMAYMLSAQLAAMALNVEAGLVSSAALIYAPGTLSANPLGFASVGAVMAEADALLGADGLIPEGDPSWARAVALKNALDRANNNLNFVQSRPCAFTFPVVDRIIDADGIASPGDGIPAAVNVAVGNALHPFPVTFSNNSGLDMFDNDGNGAWTFGPGGDDLMAEGTAFCPDALRNGQYDGGFDCVVLDQDASLANGQPVNCDLEFLIAFTACPANVTFHDMDLDGAWDSGEDIVLDVNANGMYD